MEIEYTLGECTLGRFVLGVSAAGICLLELGDDDQAMIEGVKRRFPRASIHPAQGPGAGEAVAAFLDRGEPLSLPLPLDLQGTGFQQRVWQALRAIPSGETRSYRQLAEMLGQPRAVRAVAGACAANKITVAVPCHRVIRSDGGLGGYRWGLARKRSLLEREANALFHHLVP